MMSILTTRNFYLFIFCLSIISLVSAIYIEYYLGFNPCILCLYQRIPHLISIFICFFGYNFSSKKIWLYLIILIFIGNLIIAGYHFGIENNLFSSFAECKVNNTDLINKNEILNSMDNLPASCENVTFKIAGFSLATINLFISTLILCISSYLIVYGKNR